MADPLPPDVVLPDPRHVAEALAHMGWTVTVYTSPDYGPMHYRPDLPDRVWLAALRTAGMFPVPCVGCYEAGDGTDCMAGRCRRSSGLILPPDASWR